MSLPPKSPPRFVPTLTEVVREPVMAKPVAHADSPVSWNPPVSQVALGALSPQPLPPVNETAPHAFERPGPGLPSIQAPVLGIPVGLEEHLVHRVMQRVDIVLDLRLREAIATVVHEQTRSVLPRLREEIESVVRHAVFEAVADELMGGQRPTPRG